MGQDLGFRIESLMLGFMVDNSSFRVEVSGGGGQACSESGRYSLYLTCDRKTHLTNLICRNL